MITPIKYKQRVMLAKGKPVVRPAAKPKPSMGTVYVWSPSRGMVSHIWDAWKCKNYDV